MRPVAQPSRPPPSWLRAWRSVTKKLLDLRRYIFTNMACAVNLGTLDIEIYQAVLPILDVPFANPQGTCRHPDYVRYGNAYGKFASARGATCA